MMRGQWIVVGCVWLAATVPAVAQSVQRLDDGRVAVNAEGVPLGQILRELGGMASATLRIDPAVEGRPVNLHLDSATVEQALAELLRNSDVNFVAVGLETTSARGPIRIVAGDPRAAAEVGDLAGTSTKVVAPLDYATPAIPSDAEMIANKERERLEGVRAEQQSESDVPGQMSNAEWEQALVSSSGARSVRQGLVMLPFPGQGGVPLVEDVGSSERPTAMLPFVDQSGQPIVVPAIAVPGAPVMLPFSERGVPMMVPAPGTASPRPPGR